MRRMEWVSSAGAQRPARKPFAAAQAGNSQGFNRDIDNTEGRHEDTPGGKRLGCGYCLDGEWGWERTQRYSWSLADGCPQLQSQQQEMLRQAGPSRPRVHSKNALLSRCLALATVWALKLTKEYRENRGKGDFSFCWYSWRATQIYSYIFKGVRHISLCKHLEPIGKEMVDKIVSLQGRSTEYKQKKKELNLLSSFISWWKRGSKRVNNLFKFSVIKSKLPEGNLNLGL